MKMKPEQQVANFNAHVPVGAPVNVTKDDGSIFPTKTRSPAWVMGGHSAMVMVEGIPGGYAVERVSLAEPQHSSKEPSDGRG